VTVALPPERQITYRSIMSVDREPNDEGRPPDTSLDRELSELRDQVARLGSENARLLRLLELSPVQARPPGPTQTGIFDGPPGMVDATSSPEMKIAFFASMFAARTDVHAVRWQNVRTGRSGWMPAVRGGWRKGVASGSREYLPLTADILGSHLTGDIDVGLYPLLNGDRCWWLAADFDGSAAMLDALSYLKAGRAVGAPVALEVSRSGQGAHAWLFFTGAVAAATARQVGTGLLREAIALRGRMDLSSYDRLFPSQDVLPTASALVAQHPDHTVHITTTTGDLSHSMAFDPHSWGSRGSLWELRSAFFARRARSGRSGISRIH